MKWANLKEYKCPKDGEPLKDIGHYHACTECVFSINKPRFDKIVTSQYKPRNYHSEEDNLSEWNNYGRKPMSTDFSDSY